MLVQSFTERLRPLVGIKSWDYIILWKLSNDQRCIEWMGCCCAGSENIQNGGEELSFLDSSSNLPCRDVMFPHPRITPCDLLDQIPSSMALDSGVHAQTLFSNQASWLNYSHNLDSNLPEETIGTRVLIPLPLGLLELFVAKQVPEDQQVIEFIRAQCNIFLEQQTALMSNNSGIEFARKENSNLGHDHIHLQQTTNANGVFLEGTTYDSTLFTPSMENGFNMMSNSSTWVEDHTKEDDSFVFENNRSDNSDPNEDEFDDKYRRRGGKGGQSKNLNAERKRRKKLNDRLYALRAMVPKISKLDRASILGDAIDYVKELQNQAEELQIELEQQSDDDGTITKTRNNIAENVMNNNIGFHKGSSGNNNVVNVSKQKDELDNTNDKVQQMEPQVEVFQLDGNEFLVKVFCEYKCGGFVRLMEALSSLGLEVVNVNTTRHTCLVSSIFKVERKNDEMVQADCVKESLLSLTRNPSRLLWAQESENGSNIDDDDGDDYHHIRRDHTHHSILLQH